jgi:hypothetical protein
MFLFKLSVTIVPRRNDVQFEKLKTLQRTVSGMFTIENNVWAFFTFVGLTFAESTKKYSSK